ncbi:MAG: hypothetical protein ACOYM9_18440 [Bradymonadia bacterium]|jgi:hypothetical protein
MYVSLACRRLVGSLALCAALALTACTDASAPEGTTPGATAARYGDAVLSMRLPSLERRLRDDAPAPASWASAR